MITQAFWPNERTSDIKNIHLAANRPPPTWVRKVLPYPEQKEAKAAKERTESSDGLEDHEII